MKRFEGHLAAEELDAMGFENGARMQRPLFRAVDRAGRVSCGRLTARIVGERVKKMEARSGLDPSSYAAHSLRSGFATSRRHGRASRR